MGRCAPRFGGVKARCFTAFSAPPRPKRPWNCVISGNFFLAIRQSLLELALRRMATRILMRQTGVCACSRSRGNGVGRCARRLRCMGLQVSAAAPTPSVCDEGAAPRVRSSLTTGGGPPIPPSHVRPARHQWPRPARVTPSRRGCLPRLADTRANRRFARRCRQPTIPARRGNAARSSATARAARKADGGRVAPRGA
jgi:hypothetical protein